MRSIACVLVAGLAAVGCKKESAGGGGGALGGEPIAAASTDALWAFAPPGATVAVVVADGVLEPAYTGALKAIAALDRAPGGSQYAAMIRQQAKTPIGDVLDRATLDALGIDLRKGIAFFESESAKVAVLPIADSKKFAGKLGAPFGTGVIQLGPLTCKDVTGRLLCADSQASLDAAVKGGGASQVASWPKEMRGHVEVFVAASRLDADIPLEQPGGLRASAVLEKGALTARVHVIGKPSGPLAAAMSGKSSLASGVADQQPTGLMVLNAGGPWRLVQAKASDVPAQPLPGGVTARDLISAPSGEAIGYALPGQPLRGIGKIGLANAEPVKKLLAACDQFAAMAPPGVTIKKSGTRCSLAIDPKALGAPQANIDSIAFDAWVESNALVVGLGNYAAKSTARPGLAPFAREILDGGWLFAAWGRGTLAGAPMVGDPAQIEAALKNEPIAALAVWGIYHLSEFGVAGRVSDDGIHGLARVRTLWANPDDVVTAVEEKVNALAGGDTKAIAAMAEVAKKYPGSPFAADVEAGAGGLMAPVALVGIVAAVSIPAFLKYKTRSEGSEARIHLMRVVAAVQEYAIAGSTAPGSLQGGAPHLASGGPTPPLGTCCQQGGTCQPNPAWWNAEPWKSLHFAVDEPHRYSYEYRAETDGGFTVLAYGDLDCDGTYSTFSMHAPKDGAPGMPEMTRENEDE